jgi:hypothetical protein
MKIKPGHYEYMRDTITTFVKENRHELDLHKLALANNPQVKDVGKRLRWDIAYAAGLSQYICDNMYPYANDEHVDTVLRNIMKEVAL